MVKNLTEAKGVYEINGVKVQTIEHGDCIGCYFHLNGTCDNFSEINCIGSLRQDGKSVIFKKIEEDKFELV